MNNTTSFIILLTILLIFGVGFNQFYGIYSIKQCAEITELVGSDFQQCFSGNYNGIVGLDLHVHPIAYKIARNKNILLKYIRKWQAGNISAEIVGMSRKRKLHNVIGNEKIAAIAREIYNYLPSKKTEHQELQEYSQQNYRPIKKVIQIQDYKED